MKKPVGFRTETWDFVVQSIGLPHVTELTNAPGRVVVKAGIMGRPHLLANTVIELPDECEYLIRAETAKELTLGHKSIAIERLYDKRIRFVSSDELLAALKASMVFDQLER
jgi:hypothetical protein